MGFEKLTEHIKGSYINDIGTAADLLRIITEMTGNSMRYIYSHRTG